MRTGGVYDALSAKKTGGEDRYIEQILVIDPAAICYKIGPMGGVVYNIKGGG